MTNVVLKTEKHEYYANYNLPYLIGDWFHLDDKGKSVDENNIIYDASAKDGKYIKPNKPETSTPALQLVLPHQLMKK
ncbi:hypothetical protein [Bacillus mycoides]|uniref:hypothetical protein n=1 Tax=Bacillus mycoides TaxID=1405 RepID=UPI00366DB80F